ncbi:alpha/beta-hydrolase [Cylindrobasidium torrendii FP15055 ss-10]|uniref:Alpha/beta-hydrolase n=1 Tax=Cylindrobasidium torrendii FP15055 ss-10 TaxID=1314674 RepID=A0A0D7B629_9AGAR|nr:alpha/beta-hydrolase [Cylindrobasidium torrendii FP15055 ss-10]
MAEPSYELPQLQINTFVIPGKNGLKAAAKRYRPFTATHTESGIIWLFAHGIGFHKEAWDTTIQRIFEQSSKSVEAWTVDCHTHGDSAELNNDIIHSDSFDYHAIDYSEAFVDLYNTQIAPHRGSHKVVLVGHSGGAASAVLTAKLFSRPAPTSAFDFPISALALIEPGIWPTSQASKHTPLFEYTRSIVGQRRSDWLNRSEARKHLRGKVPWSTWDASVLDSYVTHALKADGHGGVTLKCSPKHEALLYADHNIEVNATMPIPVLQELTLGNGGNPTVPVHVMFGERVDLFSRQKQQALVESANFASVSKINGGGHMIVQEAPLAVAESLLAVAKSLQDSVKL